MEMNIRNICALGIVFGLALGLLIQVDPIGRLAVHNYAKANKIGQNNACLCARDGR